MGDGFYLAQDARFAPAHDEFPLVRRDGAESASTEAAAVEVDREADHLERGDAFAAILGVGEARVGQVETAVDLCGGHGWIGRIDDCIQSAGHPLQDALRGEAVAFFFDVAEVGGVLLGVSHSLSVWMEHDVVGADASVDVRLGFERDGLAYREFSQEGVETVCVDGNVRPAVQQFVVQHPA